jgi:hypothetical protein
MKSAGKTFNQHMEELYTEPNTGCWLWPGHANVKGYGVSTLPGGLKWLAHRRSWEAKNGPIPDGMFVLHKCDVPLCVNPDHLFLGTKKDNNRDMARKRRSALGEKNGQSKLRADQIAEIFFLRGQGMTQKSISEKFDVSRTTISFVLSGERWGHVTSAQLGTEVKP